MENKLTRCGKTLNDEDCGIEEKNNSMGCDISEVVQNSFMLGEAKVYDYQGRQGEVLVGRVTSCHDRDLVVEVTENKQTKNIEKENVVGECQELLLIVVLICLFSASGLTV